MRLVELDIITADGGRSSETIEVADKATLTKISTIARRLLAICHWQRVRVSVGSQLSNWITEPLKSQYYEH